MMPLEKEPITFGIGRRPATHTQGTLRLTMADMTERLVLKIRAPRGVALRMAIGARLVRIGAAVMGVRCEIELTGKAE